jgi:16S rRNA (guanine527-N7)-methyltransferase
MTGDRDRALLVRRHVLDAIALVPQLPAEGLVVDVGSGAGFPGLVLGCVRPDLDLLLIEPRHRAASFLAEATRALPLKAASVDRRRAEEAAQDPAIAGRAVIVVARALRLDVFLPLAAPLISAAGRAIAMQTPRIHAAAAARIAERAQLIVAGVRDYQLPGGEPRRLIIFARGPGS